MPEIRNRAGVFALVVILGGGPLSTHGLLPIHEASGQVVEQDSLALRDLYLSLYWPSDSPLRQWFQGPVAEFPGIETTGNRVTAIRLADVGLRGGLPGSIGDLNALQVLDLSGNDLIAPFPEGLLGLTSLEYLDLSGNGFTGELPAAIGNLVNLRHLDVSDNQLSGILRREFGQLSQLEYLDLSNNTFSGTIPGAVLEFSHLRVLSVHDNAFSVFPPPVSPGTSQNLPLITTLDLSDNRFDYYSLRAVTHLTQLRNLDASGNWIKEVPAEIGNLVNLEVLDLEDNQISEPIPASLWTMSNLRELDLSGNELEQDLPPEVENLVNLVKLDLQDMLERELPAELGTLTNLESLNICGNRRLKGDIAILTPLVNLRELCVEGMGGLIPEALGHMQYLRKLDLTRTYVTGEIPDSFGGLDSLEVLNLERLLLSGPIPSTLGGLSKLAALNLSNNFLSGEIPSSLGNLAELHALDLRENNLEGGVPASIGNLTELRELDLSRNALTGTLPSEIGSLANMYRLNLSFNQFSGLFPASIADLTAMRYLYFEGMDVCFPDNSRIRSWLNEIDIIYGDICYATASRTSENPALQPSLGRNSPNPFQHKTTIPYSVPGTSEVRLELFDIVGRRVQILLQKTQPPGDHEIVLDAAPLSPGVYVVRMTSGRYTATRRLILTR